MNWKFIKSDLRRYIRYFKYHDAPLWQKIVVVLLTVERKIFNLFYYYRTKIRGYFINLCYKKHGDHNFEGKNV